MEKILGDNSYNFLASNIDLPTGLAEILDAGFREEQNCILFKDFEYYGPGEINSDFNRCLYETFINYINLNGYITESIYDFEILKIALDFSRKLHEVSNEHFNCHFRIVVSYEKIQADEPELESFMECAIKFHKIRKAVDEEFRSSILQESVDAGILILE